MGYLRKSDKVEIEVLGQKMTIEPLSYGQKKAIQTGFMKMNPRTMEMEVDNTRLFKMDDTLHIAKVKKWDLVDESGKELPINMDTVENLLDEEFITAMFAEIGKHIPNGLSEEEKK